VEPRLPLWLQYAVVACFANLGARVVLLTQHAEAGRQAWHDQASPKVVHLWERGIEIEFGFGLLLPLLALLRLLSDWLVPNILLPREPAIHGGLKHVSDLTMEEHFRNVEPRVLESADAAYRRQQRHRLV
jgi:hypothetical protein